MTTAHWIKPNETTQLPRCFLYLDTESKQRRRRNGEVQTFNLAAVAHDHADKGGRRQRPTERATFTDPAALWDWTLARITKGARMVLVAHNLSYDLRISRAFVELPARGYALTAARLDGGQAWCRWRGDDRSLVMVDSLSWFPKSLDHLSKLVGIRKPPLPPASASTARWLERCEADVEILREAWSRVMAWLEREDLGTFKLTGAGQSWAAYRHRFLTDPILVHSDPNAKAAERTAAWTGRCETWRHGEQHGGPFTEWDLEACYARIALECDVPTRLVGHRGRTRPDDRYRLGRRLALLHRCTVTTDVPVAPARTSSGIAWPVGTFETFLWDTEVRLAVANDASVQTEECWLYVRRPALAAWAEWVLGELAKPTDAIDPVVRLVLKHWSRALIGKFGARSASWEPYGQADSPDVVLGWARDAVEDEVFQLLQLGTSLYKGTLPIDGPEACPQVMSWVMAEARVRLWRCMETAGLDHVLYVDTDGLIVDPTGHRRLKAARLAGLRVKDRYQSLTLLGPRQLVAGGRLRAAGVSRSAVRVGEGQYRAEQWSGLAASLRKREPDRVTITERNIALHGTDNRRRHNDDGTTSPIDLATESVSA